MPPKAQKQKNKTKENSTASEEQREDPFQAVILTDDYETRFSALTTDTPRCLLPLCNTPLIEYTLEFLATSGVYEVIIYTGAHHQQIADYLSGRRWLRPGVVFRKVTILTSDADSVGAAMRHLDQLHILEGDFLVVSGDVICTVEMEMAIRRHKARKVADKNAIMTIITRRLETGHRSRTKLRTPVFVTDSQTNRILQFEEIKKGQTSREIVIDEDMMKNFLEIDIRQDLVDCRIDICTPDALALWTDSFDWEDPRRHFLHGTLKDYELNGKKIYLEVLEHGYAARVTSLQSYDAISRDILEGWAYPITPESNVGRSQRYRHIKKLIYAEDPADVPLDCSLEGPLMIGRGTEIGRCGAIKDSTIGRFCHVDQNVTIEGAYIFDAVTIASGVQIRKCIIGSKARIGADCIIESGSVIGADQTIPPGTTVRPHDRPSMYHSSKDVHQDSEDIESDTPSEIESKYMIYTDPMLLQRYPRTLAHSPPSSASALSSRSISRVPSSSSLRDLSVPDSRVRRDSSLGTSPSSFNSSGPGGDDFARMASNDLYEHFTKNTSYDNVRTEFLSLRMGRNAAEAEIRKALVGALCRRLKDLVMPSSPDQQAIPEKTAAKQVLLKYGQLIRSQAIFDYQSDRRTDQEDFLLSLQKECIRRQLGGNMMMAIVTVLYELDILEEEGVLQWWDAPQSELVDSQANEGAGVRKQMGRFVEWLNAADEESSEEE